MKNGKKITIIAIVGVLIVAFLVLALMFFSGNQITIARCIVNDNGSLYMVYDERPIHLNTKGDCDYETGDKLLIVHQSAFAESYPEQTRAYFVLKIGLGSEEDIPQKAFDVLIETGNWK